MIDYIKRLFKRPTEIYTARNMKNSHYFIFILLMGVTLTFLSLFSIKPEFDRIAKDYDEIQAFLPEFELINGELESEEDSFIYQTNNIVFYFDPEDNIATDLIDKNMTTQTAPISIAFMKKDIYINILDLNQTFSYSALNLTTEDLIGTISLEATYRPLFYSLMLIILLFFNLFLYLTQLLSISIFANLISVIEKTGLKFFQNAKIALLASIIPFLLMAVITALQIPIAYQYEVISTASLILFYMSIKEFKKRLEDQTKSRKK